MQDDVGGAGGVAADFEVVPAEFLADAGAEGFGDGFFGGEAGGEQGGGAGVFLAIFNFGGVQDAPGEAGSKFFVGGGDARYFNYVEAGSQYHTGILPGGGGVGKGQ